MSLKMRIQTGQTERMHDVIAKVNPDKIRFCPADTSSFQRLNNRFRAAAGRSLPPQPEHG